MFSSRKSSAPAAGGYNLTKSLRFRNSASAYLSRTPSSSGDTQKFTYSAWVKLGQLSMSGGNYLFSAVTSATTDAIRFTSGNTLQFFLGGAGTAQLVSTAVYRDPSAWYHVVVAVDTTQATASNRVRMYVNGVEITSFSTANYPSQNTNCAAFNVSGKLHTIANDAQLANYGDEYLAEVNFVNAQQLTPSSFGQTSTTTGVWIPKKYTGSYGTNGFYLDFEDTSSTAALGYDAAGSNDWTVNNISLTAGTTYDSMTDVPTLTDATTANYAVINPLDYVNINGTVTNGNLTWTTNTTSSNNFNRASMKFPTSGKFYAECTVTQLNIGSGLGYGVVQLEGTGSYLWWLYLSPFYEILGTGGSYSTIPTISSGDVIMVAIDMDTGKAWYGQNGTWLLSGDPATGTAMSNPATFSVGSSNITLAFDGRTGSSANIINANFGQRPFVYTPPTGFLRLNTFNLPTPTIGATASTQANDYFNIALYTGTGSSLSVTGVGFQPDWTWIKSSSAVADHGLYDAVRGVQKQLESNTTDAETTETTGLTAFGSDGFTVGALAQLNTSSATYIGWNWKANGAGSSNTQGSITSTVSANTTAGFSIVTYTGTGANATVGHGLGVAPSIIIVKGRFASNWSMYNASLTNATTSILILNSTSAVTGSLPTYWNSTAPTSTVFSLGSDSNINSTNAAGLVAYCFAQVAGYSAFGSYTGNGSSDGTFVYTGFRPRYVMVKCSSNATSWWVYDSSRNTYNEVDLGLIPNATNADTSGYPLDFLSNGFKFRNSNGDFNGSGRTYIYMAFAENPFKYANAR